VIALRLVSLSIGNVLSYLKIVNGIEPSEVKFTYPTTADAFVEPWKHAQGGLGSFGFNSIIEPNFITDISRDDILAVYNEAGGKEEAD
jgi:hypothetical protein